MAEPPAAPSLPWRIASSTVMGLVGASVRSFMYGLNSTEAHGLDGFIELLEKRRSIDRRERGLITGKRVINLQNVLANPINSLQSHKRVRTYHIHWLPFKHLNRRIKRPCSIDDPLIWASLPFRHHFNPSNSRWSLGSHDICFKNKYLSPLPSLSPKNPI